jgi:hypothetical protein
MSLILTGVCEADPTNRLYKVAVSRGNTFLSAKERFRVQVSFKNAITHPDEDRLLAELLTVYHFLADPSILWHMEKKVYASSTTWATTSPWLPDIYQRQASTPNVVKIIKFMHAQFPGLKTVVDTNEQGYEQALTSVDFEIPYWPVLPQFESDIGTIQVTISGMIRYTETMSNKNCKNPLDLMIKSFKSGLIPIEKMPLSKTERLMPLDMKAVGKVFTHATWPRFRYIFVPDQSGVMKLVNVVRLRLKPLEER